MFGNLNGWHLLILLAVILLLFGAARLPALAKSVGQSARAFRGEMKELRKEDEAESPDAGTARSTDAGTAPSTASDPARGSTEPKS
jgi:sec-independent protein translocase protein TatA